MRRRGKRFLAGLKTFSREKRYGLDEAITILGGFPKAKFDETVELSIKLGTDPGKTDQPVRGSVSLPKGIGKTKKVIVFADGDAARQATEAGADRGGRRRPRQEDRGRLRRLRRGDRASVA